MTRKVVITLWTAVVALGGMASGQQWSKRVEIAGDAFMIPEAGCLVTMDSTSVKVIDVAPPEMRPKGYADVDFQQGDHILMMNGARVTSVKELRERYEKAAVSDEMKFGISRKNEKHIIAFRKADPKDLPQRKMITIDNGGGGGEVLPGFAVVGMKDGKVVVQVPLPESEKAVAEGDVVRSLNGKKVTSAAQLGTLYKEIPVGGEISAEVTRGGATHTVKMKKPEVKGPVMIQK